MKRFVAAMLLFGVAILAFILYQIDLGVVLERLQQVGLPGFVLVVAIFALGTVAQAGSWLVVLPDADLDARWLYRLWKLAMLGFALETTTPFAGLGGEPVKAAIMKTHYGVRIRDATASLVISRTTDVIAQILFMSIGMTLILREEAMPASFRTTAGAGLAFFSVAVALFVVLQGRHPLTRIRSWLERGWLSGRRLGARVREALESVGDIDERLATFYTRDRGRFAGSVLFAFGDWIIGAIAIDVALSLLGRPVPFTDAIVIESFVVLVRSTFFFVPADLGTQEGAHVVICTLVTGSADLGFALATLRRARDLVFIAWGLSIGWIYSFRGADEQTGRRQTGKEASPTNTEHRDE